MKTVMAWLASVLLVVIQSVSATEAGVAQAAPKCNHCACGRACCVSPSIPASTPLPAGGVNVSSAKQLHPALTPKAQTLPRTSCYEEDTALPFTLSFRPAAVPIYDRNCSYLL